MLTVFYRISVLTAKVFRKAKVKPLTISNEKQSRNVSISLDNTLKPIFENELVLGKDSRSNQKPPRPEVAVFWILLLWAVSITLVLLIIDEIIKIYTSQISISNTILGYFITISAFLCCWSILGLYLKPSLRYTKD